MYNNPMNNLTESSLNFLTASELDRLPSFRKEPELFTQIIKSPSSRFLLIKGDEILLSGCDAVSPVLIAFREARFSVEPTEENCFLLGTRKDLSYFVLDMDLYRGHIEVPDGADFCHLRKSRLDVKKWTGAMLAYGNALISWHRNHRFCGRCGAPTNAAEWGQARYCSNKECATPHYPRTDPAIIVAVTKGEACLMARKAGWPEGLYSVVAGYVDHGESLEDAVVREVFEETGIRIKSARYHSSQPWPFPYTLMLGYFAEAEDGEICVDKDELEEAKWFTRESIIEGLKNKTHKLPSHFSISRKLISEWFNSGDKGKLADYLLD
jgi:NAD+ diphosphatase